MFTEAEIALETQIKVAPLVVLLQLITRAQTECRRMDGRPAIDETEMAVIGMARNSLIDAIKSATGKNYDVARAEEIAKLEAAKREAAKLETAATEATLPVIKKNKNKSK